MYGIWNGLNFLSNDNGKLYIFDTFDLAEAQMQFLISCGETNLEVREILPNILPKRSECVCFCHKTGATHMSACCVSD